MCRRLIVALLFVLLCCSSTVLTVTLQWSYVHRLYSFIHFSYVSCVIGCPYEGKVKPEAVAKVSVCGGDTVCEWMEHMLVNSMWTALGKNKFNLRVSL